MSSFVYICSAIAALNACNLGYDQGVNAGVGEALTDGSGLTLTDVELEFFMGILAFTSLLGALSMGFLADTFGRRFVFLLSSGIFIVGIGISIASTNYGLLMFGRAILGLGIGIGLTIGPMYISEIAPAEMRGFLVSCSEFAINVGILLGYCAGYAFRNVKGNMKWRSMIMIGFIMPTLLFFLVIFVLPESPRWLVRHRRFGEAKAVLVRLLSVQVNDSNEEESQVDDEDSIGATSDANSNSQPDSLEEDIEVISESVDSDMGSNVNKNDLRKHKSSTLRNAEDAADAAIEAIELDLEMEERASRGATYYSLIFSGGANRRKLIAGIGTAVAQQIIAEEAVLYYMIFIFADAGITSTTAQFQALMLVGLAKTVAIAAAGYCLDTYGRRPMLMLSSLGIAMSLFLLAISGSGNPILSFSALIFYVVSFSLGLGPSAWLITSEVFTADMRAKGMSMCTFSNRITAMIITTSFLSFENESARATFTFFGIIALLCILFFYRYLPETMGKELEEVAALFEDGQFGKPLIHQPLPVNSYHSVVMNTTDNPMTAVPFPDNPITGSQRTSET